jgi:hypothetical protein
MLQKRKRVFATCQYRNLNAIWRTSSPSVSADNLLSRSTYERKWQRQCAIDPIAQQTLRAARDDRSNLLV